ncbi:hypothetical protein [Bdellovibrio sp. HCB337]|uniref:hypothetical protein n=1 Tax=Bdellovibrio sp. HCB337 TaxID=3394358 RepID=UPI0039A6A775
MKLLLSLATALLLSTSALAMDSQTVTLEVNSEGVSTLQDQFYSYNFGTTSRHMPRYADFNLTNNGPGDLVIQQIATAGADFSAYHGCPSVLPPNTYCTIRVRFSPWTEGFKAGRLVIFTHTGRMIVNLSGWGSRY